MIITIRNKMYPKKSLKKCAVLCGCSSFLLVCGIVIMCFKTLIYKSILNKILVLQAGTQTFDLWKQNPIPLSLKLHLFNWTNAADIYNSSIKPHFQEIGPYVFDETKEKVNITWNEHNNTVSFYHLKKWWFNQEKSNGTLNDAITSVNPVALTSSVVGKNWSFIFKQAINVLFGSMATAAYSTHSAGEVLFDGYTDPLVTIANKLPSFGASSMPEYDKFGWFYTRNNSETYEGQFNMDTGISGQLGELHSWKFMEKTPFFPGQCGEIGGSAGEFFPANLKKDTVIKFFSPDLCRYAQLEFEQEVVVSGILGYKYVARDRFLDNGTKVPENKCFCNGECMPYGALDISACRYGSPAFVSLPHFYKADPYYTSLVDGLEPNESRHDFFMIFEPKTGMALQVSARLQVNLLLQPLSSIRIFEKAPKVYIPVLWFEQSVLVPDNIIFYLTVLTNFEAICLAIEAFKAWRKNDPPLSLDLYLFNWTNAEQIYNKSVKPNFEEVGPYRVKEVKEKTNLSWNNDNNTISYRIRKLYYFNPENSPRQMDDDNITTINAVPLTIAYQGKDYKYFAKRFLSMSMSSLSSLYVRKSAREILFDGYADGILSILSNFPALNVQERFGLFYKRNYTIVDEVFTMYIKNDRNFGRQLTWNNKNYTDFFHGHCNQIKGSATEFYPLNIQKTNKLVFYSSELCKYAELEYVREETIKGVTGYRFTANNIFDNGTLRPENRCFCNKECIPSGVLDVSKCRQNSPTFLSFPHFYMADPYYTSSITGMKPDARKHEFYIVIEPKSGIIMDIGANMQLNMLLQPIRSYTMYQDVPKIYVPMFYFSQHVALKDDLAASLRLIQNIPELLNYLSLIFVSLGLIVIVWSAWTIFLVCFQSQSEMKIVNKKFEEVPLKEKYLSK
ncbi:unnamed protein product [Ceutorhynchus assimilis]|uniref:Scavenger receptor class B member 1 n=1 Tax=Ceutorhynchus assimilis TaxID=467358 RepID=A0A9N9MYF6_9CUCU|nr:unnamed protein product [Ceutorhynchus assimilis]